MRDSFFVRNISKNVKSQDGLANLNYRLMRFNSRLQLRTGFADRDVYGSFVSGYP
jgi:hypothetical protein